jgi:hypothetical protein
MESLQGLMLAEPFGQPSHDFIYHLGGILISIHTEISVFPNDSSHLSLSRVSVCGIYFSFGHASIKEPLPAYSFLDLYKNHNNGQWGNNLLYHVQYLNVAKTVDCATLLPCNLGDDRPREGLNGGGHKLFSNLLQYLPRVSQAASPCGLPHIVAKACMRPPQKFA